MSKYTGAVPAAHSSHAQPSVGPKLSATEARLLEREVVLETPVPQNCTVNPSSPATLATSSSPVVEEKLVISDKAVLGPVAKTAVETTSSSQGRTGLDRVQPLDPASFPNAPRKGESIPPTTIPNVAFLLEEYEIRVRYNVIKKRLEVRWPGQSGTLDNSSTVALTTILSLGALNRMNTGPFPAILETIADRNPHNPVANWILSKKWDGVDRLDALQSTLVHREDYPGPLKDVLVQRWLISTVAAALSPQGFYCRGILTLQGPQSIGKTSWFRALISDPILREQVLKLDHHLDAGNKDSQITAVAHWLVEIGELDSSLKKDVARLKGFITSDRDKLRKPYGRVDSEYQRRTVFCASVNEESFLVDPTGNTRFWTIPVTKIDYQHTIDMQQLFAQIARDYENGMNWWLEPCEEALLEQCNQEHRAVSTLRERLLPALMVKPYPQHEILAYSATDALRRLGIRQPSNPQCREMGSILRDLLGSPKKIQGIQKWRIPFIDDSKTSVDSDY